MMKIKRGIIFFLIILIFSISGCSIFDGDDKDDSVLYDSEVVLITLTDGGDVYALDWHTEAIDKESTFMDYTYGYEDVYGYWKNGVWNSLSQDDGDVLKVCGTSITASGEDVYIGGYFLYKTGYVVPGYWKNDVWNPLPNKNGKVISITVSGSDVYAAGYYHNDPDRWNRVGYWKNGAWTELAPVDADKESGITSIAAAGGDIYVTGFCYDSSDTKLSGYWENGVWNTLSTAKYSEVSQVIVSGSDVYIAGRIYMESSDPAYESGYWKNGAWHAFPAYSLDGNEEAVIIKSLTISGSSVYAAGYCIGLRRARYYGVYWKNGKWNSFPSDMATISMTWSGTDIYAGGYRYNEEEDDHRQAGYYKNDDWVKLEIPED